MSDNLGKVSVIVPVYNVEQYLEECINSILHQTYEYLEILIIDDGSSDSCGKIADEYVKKDGRIKVFHKENGGVALARNFGLKHATGDYCCFIDSDDYYEPTFVEKMVYALNEHNADMVFCNYYSNYIDNEVPSQKLQEIENGTVFSPDEFMYRLYAVSGMFCFVWNKMYKKEIFHNLEFQDMICEDSQIMLYITDRCKKIVYISNVLYHYRRRKSSILNADKEAILLAELKWVKDHMNTLSVTQRHRLFNQTQKLFIRKILEKYHFCSRKTRKEIVKPLLKEEMRKFIRNPEVDSKTRVKYFLLSGFPYIVGKIAFNNNAPRSFWE